MKPWLPLFLSLVYFATSTCSHAQLLLSGSYSGKNPEANTTLILEFWEEDSWKNFESLPFANNGTFNFSKPLIKSGQYRLRISGSPNKQAHFLFNKEIQKGSLNILLNDQVLNGSVLAIDQTEESIAYQEIMTEAEYFWKLRDSLKYKHPLVMESELALSKTASRISHAYPKTFTAQFICPLLHCPANIGSSVTNFDDSIEAIAKARFHNNQWSDSRFLRSSILVRQLNFDFYYYHDQNIEADYIDSKMKMGLQNDTVQAFLFRFILDKMVDYKHEQGLEYLLTWYASDCTENNQLADATKNLITALEHCEPGKKIESLVLPNLEGTRVPLEKIYQQSEFTAILFWRSSCNHCREFEPELEKLYEKYRSKGFSVYAINVDKEEQAWRNFCSQHSYPWPNVFLAYDSRKDFSKRFPVPSTPTLIAVDKEGKIIHRLIMRSKLEDILEDFFK